MDVATSSGHHIDVEQSTVSLSSKIALLFLRLSVAELLSTILQL